jgi:hypothetical protein
LISVNYGPPRQEREEEKEEKEEKEEITLKLF